MKIDKITVVVIVLLFLSSTLAFTLRKKRQSEVDLPVPDEPVYEYASATYQSESDVASTSVFDATSNEDHPHIYNTDSGSSISLPVETPAPGVEVEEPFVETITVTDYNAETEISPNDNIFGQEVKGDEGDLEEAETFNQPGYPATSYHEDGNMDNKAVEESSAAISAAATEIPDRLVDVISQDKIINPTSQNPFLLWTRTSEYEDVEGSEDASPMPLSDAIVTGTDDATSEIANKDSEEDLDDAFKQATPLFVNDYDGKGSYIEDANLNFSPIEVSGDESPVTSGVEDYKENEEASDGNYYNVENADAGITPYYDEEGYSSTAHE